MPSFVYGAVISEKTLEFSVNNEALARDDLQIYIDTFTYLDLQKKYPQTLDLFSRQGGLTVSIENSERLFMVDKIAVNLGKPVSYYDKKRILDTDNIEDITRNGSVAKVFYSHSHQIGFRLHKGVWPIKVKVDIDYQFYNGSDVNQFPQLLALDEGSPVQVTSQYLHNYNRHFEESYIICSFYENSIDTTRLICYSVSSIRKSTYKWINLLAKIEKIFRGELIYTIGKINAQ